jgi:chromosome segregation protein
VLITFDNRARFLQADFDEVSIERVVHRDGVNEYKINGSLVRLKDVVELLAGANIGASGHHIISQGEADRILSANAKERREMIEDGLGLRVYQYKKRESERKLEKTEDNKRQVEALRRENAPHLKFLTRQMERLKRAEALREELAHKYAQYLRREDLFLTYEGDRLHAARQPLTAEQWQLDIELSAAKDALANAEGAGKGHDEALALERELTDIRRVRDSLARDIGRIEGELRAEERRAAEHAKHDGAPIPWNAASSLVADIDQELRSVETTDDVASIRSLIKTTRERLHAFLER